MDLDADYDFRAPRHLLIKLGCGRLVVTKGVPALIQNNIRRIVEGTNVCHNCKFLKWASCIERWA